MSALHQLSEIMQEDNSAVAITRLSQWVLDKAASEGYDSLSMEEKVIVHVNSLEWEMTNRGVNRLIFGSDIPFAEEMSECLRQIGAHKTATLFDEFLSMIPQYPLSEDKDEREAYFKSFSDEEIDNLGKGIHRLSLGKEDLFMRLCDYFKGIRGRMAEQLGQSR